MLHDAMVFVHVAGGLVAIVAGYAALAARKGGRPHRAAGNVFFGALLTMAGLASVLSIPPGGQSPVGGVFVMYLVASGWMAVRRPAGTLGRLEIGGFVLAASLAALGVAGGLLGTGGDGAPASGAFVFAAVAGLAAATDLRMIRRGGLTGFERVRRHLWRMCAALFVATGSFFLGQMDEIPQALHGPHLFVLALAPLVALAFWMVRTRARTKSFKRAPAAA